MENEDLMSGGEPGWCLMDDLGFGEFMGRAESGASPGLGLFDEAGYPVNGEFRRATMRG